MPEPDANSPPNHDGALPGWGSLLTEAGQARISAIEAALDAGGDLATEGRRMRTVGLSPDEVAATLTQVSLRAKAHAKFGADARRMLFTQAGLEQATRRAVAALHAQRFATAGCRSVADLGCGLGAESLALLAAGVGVQAVEIDPLTAAFATHNLHAAGLHSADSHPAEADVAATVTVGDAEQIAHDLAGRFDGAFLDPARRTAGHRDTRRLASPDDYSPSLTFAFDLAERVPTGIKLGPGFERELIPDNAEAQWVSVNGQVVETGLWFGSAAREGVRRAALTLRDSNGPDAAGRPLALYELAAMADSPDAEMRPLGEFIYEPDGAVIRARLIGLLAEQLNGAGMVSDGIAYLTSDRLTSTQFATAFRVIEELPANEKQLRRALAERSIGRLEIKKRGAPIDPAELRKRLRLKGSNSGTLIMTRAEGRHCALLVERVSSSEQS